MLEQTNHYASSLKSQEWKKQEQIKTDWDLNQSLIQ